MSCVPSGFTKEEEEGRGRQPAFKPLQPSPLLLPFTFTFISPLPGTMGEFFGGPKTPEGRGRTFAQWVDLWPRVAATEGNGALELLGEAFRTAGAHTK